MAQNNNYHTWTVKWYLLWPHELTRGKQIYTTITSRCLDTHVYQRHGII